MKRTILTLTFALVAVFASAQNDSLSMEKKTHELQEVVVYAKEVQQRDGRMIFLPSQNLKNNAYDGYSALNLLMVPGLEIDPVNHKIEKVDGTGGILVCINNRPVSSSDIATLNPKDIKRIDYYVSYNPEHPEAGTVVDFIMKRRDNGGAMFAQAKENLNIVKGSDMVDWKRFSGKSEFDVMATFGYDHHTDNESGSESTTAMSFPDANMVRQERSNPATMHKNSVGGKLSYLRYIGKHDIFYIGASLNKRHGSGERIFFESYSTDDYAATSHDFNHTDSWSAAFNSNWQKTFAYNLQIKFYLSGSFSRNDQKRNLFSLKNIQSKTGEDYYNLEPKLIIQKKFGRHNVSFNTYYNFDKSQIDYLENGSANGSDMTTGQWIFNAIDNINLSKRLRFRVNLQERVFTVTSNGSANTYTGFTPGLSLDLTLPNSIDMSASFMMGFVNPSQSYFDTTEKSIDKYQISVGSQNLGMRKMYTGQYRLTTTRKWGSLYFSANYDRITNNIIRRTFYSPERNLFVTSVRDGGIMETFYPMLDANFNLIPRKLRLRTTLKYDWTKETYTSDDLLPSLTHSNLSYAAAISYIGKDMTASLSYNSPLERMSSGAIAKIPAQLRLSLGYRYQDWNFNLDTQNPFLRVHSESIYQTPDYRKESRSYSPNTQYNMFNLTVSYRINYGKKHNYQEVDVDSEGKSGIF